MHILLIKLYVYHNIIQIIIFLDSIENCSHIKYKSQQILKYFGWMNKIIRFQNFHEYF